MSDLNSIIEEFAELEPRERLEELLEYSENLPPIPPELEAARQAGEHRLQECQSPVFLWVDVKAGKVDFHAWVAPEAPTVKGFVGILVDAFNGQSPQTVLDSPPDLLKRLGLAEALGMVRGRGLSAILFYVRTQVQKAVA